MSPVGNTPEGEAVCLVPHRELYLEQMRKHGTRNQKCSCSPRGVLAGIGQEIWNNKQNMIMFFMELIFIMRERGAGKCSAVLSRKIQPEVILDNYSSANIMHVESFLALSCIIYEEQ